MVRGYFPKLRDAALVGQARGVCPRTVVDGYRTPRMEHASGRWPKRAWHVSRKDYALSLGFHYGVRDWHRGEQRPCVGMQRVLVQLVAVCDLSYLAQVHHHYAVADVAHHRKVVGHEEVGQVELRLKLLQEVYKLSLNGHVQG